MNRQGGFSHEQAGIAGRTVFSQGAINALNSIVDQQVVFGYGRITRH